MKRILTIIICIFYSTNFVNSQVITFEKYITPLSNYGNMELKDVIIIVDSIVNTGYYNHGGTRYHGVLTSHDESGTLNYAYNYTALDSNDNVRHLKLNSIVAYDDGYIMVGTVIKLKNQAPIPGNGDVAILKVDLFGTVVNSVHIDINGGNDVANSIIAKDASLNNFIICGTSVNSSSNEDGFVMEINSSLAVQWTTNLDLRISSGTETLIKLYDIAMDTDSSIWAVGSLTNNGSTDSEGLIVKLNSSGNYLTSKRVYNSTDKEVFYHIEVDGSDLLVTGNSSVSIFGNPYDRMIALKFTKTPTLTYGLWLKTPNSEGTYRGIGYDINKFTFGSGGYYVVGKTTPNSGLSSGVLYELNTSFQAVAQYQYSGSGNTGLNAMAINNTDQYVTMDGFYTNTYIDGYTIKALYGYSGCNDTLTDISDSIYVTLDTLISNVNNDYYNEYLIISRDTLIDTLICSDTANVSSRMMILQDENDLNKLNKIVDILVYPNPTTGIITIDIKNTIDAVNYTLTSIEGRIILDGKISGNKASIDLTNQNKGIYFLKINNNIIYKIIRQ